MKIRLIFSGLLVLGIFGSVLGQNAGNENAADRTLKGNGRVNMSTLAMEFDLPLGNYPGRGINVPINLSYSLKVWRLQFDGNHPVPGGNYSSCSPEYIALFGEESASGWTTSLATPYIEYMGVKNLYQYDGAPYSYGDVTCPSSDGGNPSYPLYYVKRILVHLPSGETHELRASDAPVSFTIGTTTGTSPYNASNWNATFYAADGSNIRYVQDSSNGAYRLMMPDGSFYDFDPSTSHGSDRKATKFTDRNGNFTTYHAPDSTYPNGYWTDTLGRTIEVPIGLQAPTGPTDPEEPQEYSMPGMTGKYKFHWKVLKGSTAAESAVTNFSDALKYYGETYLCYNGQGYPTYCSYSSADTLFYGPASDARVRSIGLFNPVLLSEIELPTGQKYKFTYDVYGRIEKIYYPTGGEEHFTYAVVPTLSVLELTDLTGAANFGVVNRKVLETSGDQTPYEWSYSAAYEAPSGYKISMNNPDGTLVERFLFRGKDAGSSLNGTFGYDNNLAGMQYEKRSFDDLGQLVSRKLTTWTKTEYDITTSTLLTGYWTMMDYTVRAEWHPRVAREDNFVFDSAGNGVSSTVLYEYDGDLTLRETPVLVDKSTQYAFVPISSGSGSGGDSFTPGADPQPEPTPIPTPAPPTPVKSVETTYLIDDPNYAGVKSYYTAQNMIGLVTASQVKDGAGTVVSRSETVYDESGRSPGYRGNPTTARVWDSTKGLSTNTSAYISTSARFDTYGNQYEATDSKGNTTTTTFDTTHSAFPVHVTSPIPDPSGVNGSSTAFITTATFDPITGLPLTTTDANGLETRITYDPATLRPLNTKTYFNNLQVGSTSETVYHDEVNNYWVKNRSQIDEYKWAETITYFDGLGRAWKSEEVNSQGNIFVEKEFDAEGRVKRISNPFRAGEQKQWTTNIYDEASRVRQVILPDGSSIKTDYGVSLSNPVGVRKLITDQAGKQRLGFTDALGNMVRVVEDPNGQQLVTDYIFDVQGNLRKTVQGEQTRYFFHDSLGRLLRARQVEQTANSSLALPEPDPVTGNNSWTVAYGYDDNGNIISTTDARGISINATYDNLNRIKFRDYSDDTPDVAFYYDGRYRNAAGVLQSASGAAKGKLSGISSSESITNSIEFDQLGRLLVQQQITDGREFTMQYAYNLAGMLIEETYPSGRKVRNILDSDGDLSAVQSRKNQNAGYFTYMSNISYNSAGAVTKLRLGNGRWESARYNLRQQVTEIGLGTVDSLQDILKLEYRYGVWENGSLNTLKNNGSIAEQKITVPSGNGANGFTAVQSYVYDDLNRLLSAAESVNGSITWKETFTIDRYGNRRFDRTDGATTTLGNCADAVCNPQIDVQTNRFLAGQGYQYDANGNVTQDAEGRRFVYDAENHQVGYYSSGNGGAEPDAVYRYDGDGKRVKKVVVATGEATIFVYNASGQLVAEYSTVVEPQSSAKVSYLTMDHLGSPRVVTDAVGAVVGRKDFSAYGEEISTPQRVQNLGYQPVNVRQSYTGYLKDEESGLEFAEARYYNPLHGRFTSVDPLTASATVRNPQTFNRYAYALNSPYKFTDPLGLMPMSLDTRYGGDIGFCSASNASCEEGEDITTESIQAYQKKQQEKEKKRQEERRKKREENRRKRQQPKKPTPPPLAAAEQRGESHMGSRQSSEGLDDDYIYAFVRINIGSAQRVEEESFTVAAGGNMVTEKVVVWEYQIEFELVNGDETSLPATDYNYRIYSSSSLGFMPAANENHSATYKVADGSAESASERWQVRVSTKAGTFRIDFRIETRGISVFPDRINPVAVPIAMRMSNSHLGHHVPHHLGDLD